LVRFEQIWTEFGQICAKFGKVINNWENLIRFGQNQNLASSKTFHLLRQWIAVFRAKMNKQNNLQCIHDAAQDRCIGCI